MFGFGFILYLLSTICTQDEAKKKLLIKSAKGGCKRAKYFLGRYYKEGSNGFEKNPELAFKYLKEAKELGHIKATYHLGKCYEEGFGVVLSKGYARELYKGIAAVYYKAHNAKINIDEIIEVERDLIRKEIEKEVKAKEEHIKMLEARRDAYINRRFRAIMNFLSKPNERGLGTPFIFEGKDLTDFVYDDYSNDDKCNDLSRFEDDRYDLRHFN